MLSFTKKHGNNRSQGATFFAYTYSGERNVAFCKIFLRLL